jgi:hypothetical protein
MFGKPGYDELGVLYGSGWYCEPYGRFIGQ